MKLSEFIKKETDALSEKYVLEAAEADADTNMSPVLIRGTKMHTVKNVLTTAACAVLVVAIAVSALILPGILTGDTTPGDVVDEGTTGELDPPKTDISAEERLRLYIELIEKEFEYKNNEFNISKDRQYGYKITNSNGTPEAVLIYYLGDEESITLPKEIDGLKVAAVGGSRNYGILYNTNVKHVTIPGEIETVNGSAFQKCLIESVTIEEGVKNISDSAFSECKNLKSVILPESLEFVSGNLFSFCFDLESVEIKGGKWIYPLAFYMCNSLKSISFPDTLQSIVQDAFSFCGSLKEIVIPASVIEIGSGAFADCTSLEKVTFLSSETVVAEDAFLNTPYAEYAENVIQLEVPETFSVSDVDLSSVTAAKIYNLVTGDVAFLTEAEDVLAICDVSAALSGTDPKSSRGYYGQQYGYCLYEIELYETTKSAPILNFILCKVSDGECYVLSADIYETIGETNNYRAMYNTDGNVFKKIEKVCDDYFK